MGGCYFMLGCTAIDYVNSSGNTQDVCKTCGQNSESCTDPHAGFACCSTSHCTSCGCGGGFSSPCCCSTSSPCPANPPPAPTYDCEVTPTSKTCVEKQDGTGAFATLEKCKANPICAPKPSYACKVSSTGAKCI